MCASLAHGIKYSDEHIRTDEKNLELVRESAKQQLQEWLSKKVYLQLHMLIDYQDWPSVPGPIQRNFNNPPISTGKMPNEIRYALAPVRNADLSRPPADAIRSPVRTCMEVADSVAYAQVMSKDTYD